MSRVYGRMSHRVKFMFCTTCGTYGKAFLQFVPVSKRAEKRKTWKNCMKKNTLYWNYAFMDCMKNRHKLVVDLSGEELRKKIVWYDKKKKGKKVKIV